MKNQVKEIEQVTSEADRILQNPCASTRAAWTSRLTDQAALARIYSEDPDLCVCRDAIGAMTDQALLAKIALDDPDFLSRTAAATRLSAEHQPDVLAQIIRSDPHHAPRAAAARNCHDQALLAQVAVEDQAYDVRHNAVANIEATESNVQILQRIATRDSNAAVRGVAGLLLEKAKYLSGYRCPHCGLRPGDKK